MIVFDPSTDGSRPLRAPVGAPLDHRRIGSAAAALGGLIALASFTAGQVSGSQALQAAALVPLGAALTHGLDRVTAKAPPRHRRIVTLAKGAVLTGAGVMVLATTMGAILRPSGVPAAGMMAGIGLALVAVHCATLLLVRGQGEAVAPEAAAFVRQGAFGQLLAVLAAGGVGASGSDWPDLIVAANLAALFLLSAFSVLRQAFVEWRTGEDEGALSSDGFHKDFA